MKRVWIVPALALMFVLAAPNVFAGSPLKGVDVKLGEESGRWLRREDFRQRRRSRLWRLAKGSYTVSFDTANIQSAKPTSLHIEILGAAEGTITHVLAASSADRVEPIVFTSNGKTPLVVKVADGTSEPVDWVVRVKSHSNSTNN